MAVCLKCKGQISSGASICQWCGSKVDNSGAALAILVIGIFSLALIISIFKWVQANLLFLSGVLAALACIVIFLRSFFAAIESRGKRGLFGMLVSFIIGIIGLGLALDGYDNYQEFHFGAPE